MTPPRTLPALILALIACGCGAKPMPDVFTGTVGEWHRTSLSDLGPGQAADPLPKAGVRRIRAATYEGPGKLDARLYEMASDAGALDAVQNWSPSPDVVFFNNGPYVVVVKWQSAERKPLQAFVSDLQKRFEKKSAK